MIYTPKQLDLMKRWQRNQLCRLNLLEGSVSSGKTWISLVLWAFWVATMPQDRLYMMCAKSLTTLKRNCLILLQELVGEDNFTFSVPAKEGYLFNRHILLEGANDARAESKIRGITLQGAYCDELTQFPQDFFAMLLSRLRLPEAKLIATTNPDAPTHWLKTNYIDRADELDFLDVKFTIEDNTTLPSDYVREIKNEYAGTLYYDRLILGLWSAAEGLIYPMWQDAVAEPPENVNPSQFALSIDYGTQNAFAAILWGLYGKTWYGIREYYYSGRERGIQKTDEEYGRDMDDFTADIRANLPRGPSDYFGGPMVNRGLLTIIDPSAASFIALLRKKGGYAVRAANNDVLDGIRETATCLKLGLIKMSPKCKAWAQEVQGYVWDENSGEDRPVKEADHAQDSVRYFCFTMRLAKNGAVTKKKS